MSNKNQCRICGGTSEGMDQDLHANGAHRMPTVCIGHLKADRSRLKVKNERLKGEVERLRRGLGDRLKLFREDARIARTGANGGEPRANAMDWVVMQLEAIVSGEGS